MIKQIGLTAAVLILLLIVLPDNSDASNRIGLPDEVFYHRFASDVTGVEAVWINPAALGRDKRFHVQYITSFLKGDFTDDWGTVTAGDGFAVSYRTVEDFLGEKYREYTFGAGIGLGQNLYGGLSYRHIPEGYGYYHKRHFWNIGLLLETQQSLTFAALFSNLNKGKIDGERTDAEELYSVSYQTVNRKMTFSVEMTLSSGENLSDARYNYGIKYLPIPRLIIDGNINNDQFYQIGLRYSFGDYYIGLQGRGDEDGNPYTTSVYIGYIKYLGR